MEACSTKTGQENGARKGSSMWQCVVTEAVAVLLLLAPTAVVAAPRSMAELSQIVLDAAAAGRQSVVIPPGVYRGTPADGEKVHLTLQGAHDLEIVAAEVTMLCTRRTRAIDLVDCRNVTLRGLTIDYDPLTFTQGCVVAAAPDDGWIDVKLDAGYPRQPWSRIDVVDPATRYRKKGMPFLWGTTAELIEPDVVRVRLKGIGKAARVGDLASLSAGNEEGGVCHGMTLRDCRGGMVLRDVTIHCAPGMGIVESGGEGGTVLEGVRIVPGPMPKDASAPRLLTTSWDGILHSNVGRGPRVEHCTIESCGDDSWSVQNQDTLILRCTGNELILAPRGEQKFAAGNHLIKALDSPHYTIIGVRPVGLGEAALEPDVQRQLREAQPWTLWKVSGRLFRVMVDGRPDFKPGDSVVCPERQGNGFIFRDNRVHSPGRILIKAGDGLVVGNTLTLPHGLVVCPEVPDGAAVAIRNLVIRGNTIVESGCFCPSWESGQAGAISIMAGATENGKKTFHPAGAMANVTIEGNRLEGICGVNLLLGSVQDATVRDNRFVRTHRSDSGCTGGAYGIDQSAVVEVRRCANVTLEGNHFEEPSPLTKTRVRVDADSTNVIGAAAPGS
jgi:hypothetical protein